MLVESDLAAIKPMKNIEMSRREFVRMAAVTSAGLIAAASSGRGAPTNKKGGANSMIDDMRCEYQTNPIGIDEAQPRLSWTVQYMKRGWRQSAYRIQVASTASKLSDGHGDLLWDTGKVAGNQASQIEYGGKLLKSREQAHWRVQVWDNSDSPSSWSNVAYWEMGLLDDADWAGSAWIGGAADTGDDDVAAPFLRRDFNISRKVERARVYSCGLGYADVYLNGKRLGGDTERDSAYTQFDKRVLYVTHDVTALLSQGQNAIGTVLGTGWYDVHDLATWHFENASWRGARRLRLVLAVDYADGSTAKFVSDGNWKHRTGPLLRDGIYTGEIYDARLEMPGWDKPGFDASNWAPVSVLPALAAKMHARKCPPIAITESLEPVAITQPLPGSYVVDFGQNFSGHVQLRVRGDAGSAITMRYGEQLHADGTISVASIDHFMTKTTPPQPFQSDTYICKGGGAEEIWEQRFSYSGFRYAQVTGFPATPTTDNFRGRFAHTDFEEAGEFSCSDDMLNKIQQATLWSYKSNAQSIPTDCPQREKNGWTGDAQLAAEAGLMNFRSESFYSKWLDDIADAQSSDGRLPDIVPSGGWGMGGCNPAWDSAYPIIAWDLYRYAGDIRLLDRHFNHIATYVDYVAGRTKNGIVSFGSLGDWLPWSAETPSELTSTAYLYVDATILAAAAKLLGRSDDAKKYASLADQTRSAFNTAYFDSANNTYANGTQTALSCALFNGLVPDNSRAAVFANLVRLIEATGHIDTGILGAKWVLRTLSEGGRSDLAYTIAVRKEQPSWAWWIENGATTLWEDWKGEDSLNHIMFGDISNWMYQWIGGIGLDPKAPAFSHVLIRPTPVGDLTWARATHRSPYGTIVSHWKKDGDAFHLDIVVPANSTATVWLPSVGPNNVMEGNVPAEKSPGVRFVTQETGRTVFSVGSGTYSFVSKPG
jgi:alpha-L-rhamnosidase